MLPSLTRLLLLSVCCLQAQVQSHGRFRSSVACPSKAGSIRSTRIYTIPAQDNQSLLSDAQSEESSYSSDGGTEDFLKPYKFAEAVHFDLDIQKDGVWETHKKAGYRVWRATVTSPSAKSLGLVFKDFHLPHSGELYIVGQDRILGAFIGDVNNKPTGEFSTAPLPGEALLLEYYEALDKDETAARCLVHEKLGFLLGQRGTSLTPSRKKPAKPTADQVRLALASVSHGFRPYNKNYEDSQSCQIDVACEPQIAGKRQVNSVVLLLTQSGTRVCTGAFINNSKKDGRQLLLTAKHCMNEDPSNFILIFNYQHKVCGQRPQEPETIQSAHGMTVLSSWVQSDFAIVEVKEHIPDDFNVYMAGWDLSPEAPENIYTIHHPSGDVKKISYYHGTTQLSSWQEAPRTFHWKVPTWTKGSTERGSSGAPMFNSRGLIVGHLHGGSASCLMKNGFDNFGGLYFDWASGPTKQNRLRDILNPTGKHISAMKGEYLSVLRKQQLQQTQSRHHRHSSSSSRSIGRTHRHHQRRHHRHAPKQQRQHINENMMSASYTDSLLFHPSADASQPSYHYQSQYHGHEPVKGRQPFHNRDVIDMILYK